MNGTTKYQGKVNNLTGALGPKNSAFWKNTTKYTGSPFGLNSQPLMYDPALGVYITASDAPAAMGSVNFSNFGFGRKYSRRGRSTKKRSRRTKKRSRRTKKRSRRTKKRSRRTKKRSNKRKSRRH